MSNSENQPARAAASAGTGPHNSYIIEDQAQLTDIVVAAMSQAPNARLREVMESFVRHMHSFAREVRVTEEEFSQGVEFLNRIGQSTNDMRNEGILFSDAIGFSTLVCLLNNGQTGATETASALLGPFWRMHSPATANGGSIVRSSTPGHDLFAYCRIADHKGQPLAGVEVDVWQSSPVGLYENQDPEQADMNLRGKFVTDHEGRFWFRSVKPAGYPVPTDGPIGDLLRAQLRHPYRPAHLHFLAHKEGYKTLITQVFVDDDKYLHSDVVFGVTRHLVGQYREGEGAPPEPGFFGPWSRLDYAFVMEPGQSKLPTPPIK
jgi:protocatechuate 3,4-dioxygenase beta subunit